MELKIEKKLKEVRDELNSLLDDYQLAMAKLREVHGLLARHFADAPDINGNSRKPIPALDSLSDREKEIFYLIGQELKSAAIAEQLGISLKTFYNLRDKIRRKLGIKSSWALGEAAKEAVQNKP